ncbi:four-carbon acid sugar kinase family protein [Hufsiella ginkgonis]|uniref:Four-carbon acid sugar kinase family protein n=1 Tax=Hufsiella ginkgonis TaxID=2695274 RepID=A0A7K1XW70_9SPHI|nr:four-carbon acid sugar kinase family protein [Hufsiella ginkgonis]MXV15232.1 four-carbon acid sugar kinase family protein [Hufsiella ginkgonis]
MQSSTQLLLGYYGDDFTGSTDAMEMLSRSGVRTVLFITPPSAETLRNYPGIRAFGVAGLSRSLEPEDMASELSSAFWKMRQTGARHIHYKVCSTFDSSPAIGNIGTAIETGTALFPGRYVPLLVAAPTLGRYCVFGNLFASVGIGSAGEIFRLDRHPSMKNHPVTPADEADLRVHLGKQTGKKIGLVDILDLGKQTHEVRGLIDARLKAGHRIILFDGLYDDQLRVTGEVIDQEAEDSRQPFFSVGSSGIEMALGKYWTSRGMLTPPVYWPNPAAQKAILVISGSCSPVTARQIGTAVQSGFAEISLEPAEMLTDDPQAVNVPGLKIAGWLKNGTSVIVHTSKGIDDDRIARSRALFASRGIPKSHTSRIYGTVLGNIARAVVQHGDVSRIVIAGGDTSSFAARAMGIEAVEMIAPLSPGAPLCKAYAPGSPLDGKEVVFKGGQVGGDHYFIDILNGKI